MVLMTWVLAIVFGVFCGLVFWDLDFTVSGVQNRAGTIFFCLVFLAFLSVTSIDSLIYERAIVRKEQRLGYYPAMVYLIAKCLLDSLLMRAIPAVLFTVPVYYMASLQRSLERLALYVFVMIAFTIGAQFQAMLLVEWSSRAGNAMVLFVLLLIVQMLFAGFLVSSDSISPSIAWVQFFSLFYYAFEALAVNEFQVRCDPVGRNLACCTADPH
jgi:ABC-type multidrug transport system permease subunit